MNRSPRGTIIYDGSCGVCGRLFPRFASRLGKRGLRILPLQSPEASSLAGASVDQLMTQLHVMSDDRTLVGGLDAVLFIAGCFWWARPFVWIARRGPVHQALDRGYRWIAENRYRIFGTCRISAAPRARRFEVIRWLPLIVLPMLVVAIANNLAPWQYMTALAFAIYLGCKWLTFWPARRLGSIPRRLAYLLIWPGMHARRFLASMPTVKPRADDWLAAIGKTFTGSAMLLLITRLVPIDYTIARGWCAMIGIVLILHFGVFELIALLLRARGIDADSVMHRPAHAQSLADFWGRRWNTAFQALMHELVYRPIVRSIGVIGATIAAFLVSGLVHDFVISIPAGGGYGLPTLYFMIQCAGVLCERSTTGRRMLRTPTARRVFALTLAVLPLPLVFHAPFVRGVMAPLADALVGSLLISTSTLQLLLVLAGILHLCITSAGLVMTIVLDWRKNLAPLCALTRHVIWTHGGFVLLTIIGFGAISLFAAPALASGSTLARAVCAFIALFWGVRLLIQFFLFDARPFLTNTLLSMGYHGLTVVFGYFVIVYGLAATIMLGDAKHG